MTTCKHTSKLRHPITLIAIMLFGSLLMSGCKEKKKEVIQIGLLNGPSSIGMVHSIKKDTYFEEKSVDFIIKDNPQHIRALMTSDHMDMAILPMTMVYSMIENNIDIKIFAITGWGNLYLLGREQVTDLADITGKTISVPGEGQTPDLVTNFLLSYHNLKDKVSLNYTYPAPLLLASALAVGKIDYAVLPEPLASLALTKNKDLERCLDLGELWSESLPNIPLVQSVFIVRSSFYNENQAWFTAYANEIEKNVTYTLDNQEEAIDLAKKFELLPPTLPAQDIMKNSHLDFRRDKKIADDITSYLKTFYVLDDTFNISSYLITK